MSSASGEPKLVKLDDLPGVLPPDETLGTVSDSMKPLRCRAEARLPIASGASRGPALTVQAGSEVSVFVFNASTDFDPDLVLVPPAAGGQEGRTGQLELSPESCWVKVQHRADLATDGGGHLGGTGLRTDAETPVIFSDYRLHERSENAARAVVADLFHPRFAQHLGDVQALRPNEALALQASGRVRTVVEVGWSDVLAGGLGALAGIVGAGLPLVVEMPAAASVSGTVTLADQFTVVFCRLPDGCTRVAVKKTASRSFAGAADLGLSVELADPQQLQTALRDVVAGLLGEDYATVRALVDKASLSELSELERWAAEALAERLGLGELVDCFATLREKLVQLEGVIAEAVAELATEKLAAGFAYEYGRLARGSNVFEAVLDPGGLATHHASLCRGDLEPVLTAIREGTPGITLASYLHRHTLERAHSWGFTLGIGQWAARGRQRRALTRVVEEDIAGRRKVSCLGLGAYEGRWLTDVAEWTVDLRADMPRFTVSGAPRLSEFALGLHLAWHWRQEALGEERLDDVLDAAVLWGVLEQEHSVEVRRRLAPAIGRPADINVQMRFDDATFRAVLPALATARDADFAAALGAAMPRRSGTHARGDPDRRRELYGSLWAHVLDHPDAPARALVVLARQHLGASAEPQLGFLEENYLKLAPTCTFVGLARVANQTTAAAWQGFRSGAGVLHEAVTADAEEDGTLEKVFALMVTLWAQTHHVRALGAYLLDAASTAGVAAAVVRSLTVSAREADGEKALVVVAPAS